MRTKEEYAQLLEGMTAGARPWVDISDFKIYQDADELASMLAATDGIESYLEIGTASGALLEFMWKVLGLKVYGIDMNLPAKAYLKRRMFLGDSSSSAALAWAKRRGPFDLVFIDGGHTCEQVQLDWELYAPLARKYVAFHDINHDTWTGVVEFWRGLDTPGKVEFVNPSIIGLGIGLVVL